MPWDGTEYTGDPILAVIDRVDRLICDEEHWGIGGWARLKPVPDENRLVSRAADGGLRHCPNTAIFEAAGLASPTQGYFVRAVIAIAPEYKKYKLAAVPFYNNADERTFPEIKALIRKAHELRLADIMETVR